MSPNYGLGPQSNNPHSFQHSNCPDSNNLPPFNPGMYDNPHHQPSSYPIQQSEQ